MPGGSPRHDRRRRSRACDHPHPHGRDRRAGTAAVIVEPGLHRLYRHRAGGDGAGEGGVRILDMEMDTDGRSVAPRRGRMPLRAGIGEHDAGIADLDLGVPDPASGRIERAGRTVDGEIGGDAVISARNWRYVHGSVPPLCGVRLQRQAYTSISEHTRNKKRLFVPSFPIWQPVGVDQAYEKGGTVGVRRFFPVQPLRPGTARPMRRSLGAAAWACERRPRVLPQRHTFGAAGGTRACASTLPVRSAADRL